MRPCARHHGTSVLRSRRRRCVRHRRESSASVSAATQCAPPNGRQRHLHLNNLVRATHGRAALPPLPRRYAHDPWNGSDTVAALTASAQFQGKQRHPLCPIKCRGRGGCSRRRLSLTESLSVSGAVLSNQALDSKQPRAGWTRTFLNGCSLYEL